MLASVDKGFVLLAQQKTGTTTLERAFKPHSEFHVGGRPKWKHITYLQFKTIFGDFFESRGCEIFGVVRDPIDHMQSIYRFRTIDSGQTQTRTNNVTFQQFINAWLSDAPPKYTVYRTPREFYRTAYGTAAPISYYRYEALDALQARLAYMVGKEITLKQVNVSPKMELEFDRETLMQSDRMKAEYEFYNS